jgi:hypothetical protein
MNEEKEIIIDGIDVAGCEFLRYCVIPENEGCEIDDNLCCDVGNCYFKQLERSQKENKELKEENVKLLFDKGTLIEFCNKLTKIIDEKKENEAELYEKNVQLQEENEKLKKKNKELLNLSNKGGALLVAESTKNKKYKQALEEIKEDLKPLEDYDIVKNVISKINKILEKR